MTAPPSAVARIAGWHEVGQVAVVPVMVKVVDDQRIGVLRVGAFPSDRPLAPMARMRTRSDRVVESHPVDISAPAREGERMVRELPYPVSLLVKHSLRGIQASGPRKALTMHLAEAVPIVRAVAFLDIAAVPVPSPVDIAVMLQAPVVHLAQPLAFVWLRAVFNRALRCSRRTLKRAERVAVAKEAATMLNAVAMGIVGLVAAVNRALSHGPILADLRAANPGFYGATFCVSCSMHRPVGKHGEFTWMTESGEDTTDLVGT